MATRKKPAAKTSKSKAVATWEEELAKEAEVAAAMEANAGGGQFFSIKGGALSWNDAPIPDNEMAVIILDSVLENVYFEGPYDPDTPQAPVCFAFGRAEDEMGPHLIVTDAGQQLHEQCDGCEMNEWGSADVGRGKACRNTRRLAMIPAGQFDRSGEFEVFEDAAHFETAQVGYMKLPVTSVNGYAAFVKQVAGALKRPPFGIITKVSLVPDDKTQFKVVFEPMEKVGDELMPIVMDRHNEAKTLIEFPYQLDDGEYEEPAPKKTRRAPAKKKAPAKKAPAKKKAAARRGRKY